MKPKLFFYYSWIYDKKIHQWQGKKFRFSRKIINYVEILKKEWKKVERKAFNAIAKVSGLKWHKPYIDCYVVRRTKGFSMPLTIGINKNLKKQVEIIIHELVHNIISQNFDKIKKKYWEKYRKYGKLTETTRNHILVHAILKEVLVKLYGEKQTKVFIQGYDNNLDYKKAWEIVLQEGSEKIIKDAIKTKSF